MAAAASKRRFQFSMFMLSIYTMYLGGISMRAAILGGAHFQATTVRLVAIGLRDPALPASAVNISALGVLRDGCRC